MKATKENTVNSMFDKLLNGLKKEADEEKDEEQKRFVERVMANINLWAIQYKAVRG